MSPKPKSKPERSSGRTGVRRSRASSKERGFRPPTEESFAQDVGPEGALYVGSPETVAEKIAANLGLLGANRFDLKFGMPGLTHDQIMTTIELYGTQVIPRVRERIGNGSIAAHPRPKPPDEPRARPDAARPVGRSRASDRERARCGFQGGLDRGDEIAGRGRRELDRDPRRGPVRRVGEVDVERVLGHRMDRMVEVDRAIGDVEPAAPRSLRAALERRSGPSRRCTCPSLPDRWCRTP